MPAVSIILFHVSFIVSVLDVSTAETFELSCVSTNIHFDSPETPPNRIINCSVANGTIAEIFCIYDSVTASDVTTVTEC